MSVNSRPTSDGITLMTRSDAGVKRRRRRSLPTITMGIVELARILERSLEIASCSRFR